MKSIVISSNTSGGGKTTLTLGLMKALMNRGFEVQGFKIGPDYIDTAYHSTITGSSSRNLDLFLMGEEGVKASFNRGKGDFGVVEGVMGLYDGIGIDTKFSTAHHAKLLELPILLVITPQSQVATLCAEINGIINYENVDIPGIILNNISEGYYRLLKASIEVNCKVKVLGYLPASGALNLNSRHLGLVQSVEVEDIKERIQSCSELIEEYIDLDAIIELFKENKSYEDSYHYENLGIRIGVAYDKAFSFYYKENLELLEELGEVIFFSPIKDKRLPHNIDFLYIGGGYPEIFSKELRDNVDMRNDIKNALEAGLKCYAECGGLMYLTKSINDEEMVGFFNGNTYLTKNLKNFGYAELKISNSNSTLPLGMKINCHEFHTSGVELEEVKTFEVSKTMYDNTVKSWECGYTKNNTLAGFPHVHFWGNIEFIKQLIKSNKNKNSLDKI